MYQGYGQTEVPPIAMIGPRQWFAKDVPGSQPLPVAQLQILDEDNNPVQRGEAGRDRAKKATAERHRSPQGQWQSLQARPCRRHGDLGRAAAVRRGVRDGRSVSHGERTGRALFRSPRLRSARSSARNFASRSGLLGSAGPQATDGVRGTLARTSQEVRAIHLLRRVL